MEHLQHKSLEATFSRFLSPGQSSSNKAFIAQYTTMGVGVAHTKPETVMEDEQSEESDDTSSDEITDVSNGSGGERDRKSSSESSGSGVDSLGITKEDRENMTDMTGVSPQHIKFERTSRKRRPSLVHAVKGDLKMFPKAIRKSVLEVGATRTVTMLRYIFRDSLLDIFPD